MRARACLRAADSWSRLRNMPHGSNRRALPYDDRYILLLAGYRYARPGTSTGRRPTSTPRKRRPATGPASPRIRCWSTTHGQDSSGRQTSWLRRPRSPLPQSWATRSTAWAAREDHVFGARQRCTSARSSGGWSRGVIEPVARFVQHEFGPFTDPEAPVEAERKTCARSHVRKGTRLWSREM